MAGAKGGEFRQLLSPYLAAKLGELEEREGVAAPEYLAIARQYLKSPLENLIRPESRRRHYESEVELLFDGVPLVGVERLYRHTILIEPSTVCAAHCRWCLRGQYPVRTMSRDDVIRAARYASSPELRDDVREVLITGGDPLMVPPLVQFTIEALQTHAPNIRIVRIGSRVPFHDPERINDALLEMFSRFPGLRFEIGLNVNHPVEFWPESVAAIDRLRAAGVRLYNQHPLLKGVNDDLATLVDLYSLLREHDIEAHYLFHAIPLRGMDHHRTSVARGLELANQLSACGEFSGRAKPRFAVLSDIGKIVLYHDTIQGVRPGDNALLLRSGFRAEDRQRWNPSWTPGADVSVDEDGFLTTWYIDGSDEVVAEVPEALAS
jgi:lysine 2,3-aminomutase